MALQGKIPEISTLPSTQEATDDHATAPSPKKQNPVSRRRSTISALSKIRRASVNVSSLSEALGSPAPAPAPTPSSASSSPTASTDAQEDKFDIKETFEGVVKAREMLDSEELGENDVRDHPPIVQDENPSTPPPPATKPRAKTQTVYPSTYPIKVNLDMDEVEAEKERIKRELEKKDKERERENRMKIILNQQQRMKSIVKNVRGEIKTTAKIDSLEIRLITSYCSALESLQVQHKLLYQLKAASRGHQVELRKFQKNLKDGKNILKGRMIEVKGTTTEGENDETRKSTANGDTELFAVESTTLSTTNGTNGTNGTNRVHHYARAPPPPNQKFGMVYNRSDALPTARRDTFLTDHRQNPKRVTMKDLTAGVVKVSTPKTKSSHPPPPPKRLGMDRSYDHKGGIKSVRRVSFTLK